MRQPELETVLSQIREMLLGKEALFKNVSDLARTIAVESGRYHEKSDAALSSLHQALRGDRPYNGPLAESTAAALSRRLRASGTEPAKAATTVAQFHALAQRAEAIHRTRLSRLVERRRPLDELLSVDGDARDLVVWNGAPQGTLHAVSHPLRQSMFVKLGLTPGDQARANYTFIVHDQERAERGWKAMFEQVTGKTTPGIVTNPMDKVDADSAFCALEGRKALRVFWLKIPQVPASFVLYDYHILQQCACFVLGQTASGEPWPMRMPKESAHVYAQFCSNVLNKRSEREKWFEQCRWSELRDSIL